MAAKCDAAVVALGAKSYPRHFSELPLPVQRVADWRRSRGKRWTCSLVLAEIWTSVPSQGGPINGGILVPSRQAICGSMTATGTDCRRQGADIHYVAVLPWCACRATGRSTTDQPFPHCLFAQLSSPYWRTLIKPGIADIKCPRQTIRPCTCQALPEPSPEQYLGPRSLGL